TLSDNDIWVGADGESKEVNLDSIQEIKAMILKGSPVQAYLDEERKYSVSIVAVTEMEDNIILHLRDANDDEIYFNAILNNGNLIPEEDFADQINIDNLYLTYLPLDSDSQKIYGEKNENWNNYKFPSLENNNINELIDNFIDIKLIPNNPIPYKNRDEEFLEYWNSLEENADKTFSRNQDKISINVSTYKDNLCPNCRIEIERYNIPVSSDYFSGLEEQIWINEGYQTVFSGNDYYDMHKFYEDLLNRLPSQGYDIDNFIKQNPIIFLSAMAIISFEERNEVMNEYCKSTDTIEPGVSFKYFCGARDGSSLSAVLGNMINEYQNFLVVANEKIAAFYNKYNFNPEEFLEKLVANRFYLLNEAEASEIKEFVNNKDQYELIAIPGLLFFSDEVEEFLSYDWFKKIAKEPAYHIDKSKFIDFIKNRPFYARFLNDAIKSGKIQMTEEEKNKSEDVFLDYRGSDKEIIKALYIIVYRAQLRIFNTLETSENNDPLILNQLIIDNVNSEEVINFWKNIYESGQKGSSIFYNSSEALISDQNLSKYLQNSEKLNAIFNLKDGILRDKDIRSRDNLKTIIENSLSSDQKQFETNGKIFLVNVFEKIGEDQSYVVLHDDENQAFDTALWAVSKYGGRLIAYENNEERYLYDFKDENFLGESPLNDPNRIFAKGSYRDFSDQVFQLITENLPSSNPLILALHNNSKYGNFSVYINGVDILYQDDNYFNDARLDKKSLIWAAGKGHYSNSLSSSEIQCYQDKKLNLVYETVKNGAGDGSLSVFAVNNNYNYRNIEIVKGVEGNELSETLSFENQKRYLEGIRDCFNK
ncbi:MAG: hypothetical protein ACOC1K_07770, partial [Nanoarchaeota archaeon]